MHDASSFDGGKRGPRRPAVAGRPVAAAPLDGERAERSSSASATSWPQRRTSGCMQARRARGAASSRACRWTRRPRARVAAALLPNESAAIGESLPIVKRGDVVRHRAGTIRDFAVAPNESVEIGTRAAAAVLPARGRYRTCPRELHACPRAGRGRTRGRHRPGAGGAGAREFTVEMFHADEVNEEAGCLATGPTKPCTIRSCRCATCWR